MAVIKFNELIPRNHAQNEEIHAAGFTLLRKPKPAATSDSMTWHRRLGHLGADALEHLVLQTTGAKIKGPIKIECKDCSLGKAV